jgi:hypothetical protein
MRRVLLALGWFFLISKIVGFGVAIPHSAVMAHSKQDCEAIRQTVEYFI